MRPLGLAARRPNTPHHITQSSMDRAVQVLEVATAASKAIPVVGNYLEGVLGTALQIARIAEVCLTGRDCDDSHSRCVTSESQNKPRRLRVAGASCGFCGRSRR